MTLCGASATRCGPGSLPSGLDVNVVELRVQHGHVRMASSLVDDPTSRDACGNTADSGVRRDRDAQHAQVAARRTRGNCAARARARSHAGSRRRRAERARPCPPPPTDHKQFHTFMQACVFHAPRRCTGRPVLRSLLCRHHARIRQCFKHAGVCVCARAECPSPFSAEALVQLFAASSACDSRYSSAAQARCRPRQTTASCSARSRM